MIKKSKNLTIKSYFLTTIILLSLINSNIVIANTLIDNKNNINKNNINKNNINENSDISKSDKDAIDKITKVSEFITSKLNYKFNPNTYSIAHLNKSQVKMNPYYVFSTYAGTVAARIYSLRIRINQKIQEYILKLENNNMPIYDNDTSNSNKTRFKLKKMVNLKYDFYNMNDKFPGIWDEKTFDLLSYNKYQDITDLLEILSYKIIEIDNNIDKNALVNHNKSVFDKLLEKNIGADLKIATATHKSEIYPAFDRPVVYTLYHNRES